MDPSEFEDVVEKKGEILHAGALEDFLRAPEKEVFKPFDILKEADNLYISLYNVQESLKKFENISTDE
jgi:hypothetical protein